MVRLAVSVEGATEERLIQSLIAPHLATFEVEAVPILLGHALGHQGGDVSLRRIQKDLNQLAQSFDFVSTLYDYYGFQIDLKGETKASLEDRIKGCVTPCWQAKLLPYIQMYEFEGILFSSPEAMAFCVGEKSLESWAQTVLKNFNDNPEQINNSLQTAPSKRLQQQTDYRKSIHGPAIAQQIGLPLLRERCAGFDAWITSLEMLGRKE